VPACTRVNVGLMVHALAHRPSHVARRAAYTGTRAVVDAETRVRGYPGSEFDELSRGAGGMRREEAAITMQPEFDPDAISTVPMNKIAVLREEAHQALRARDAIDDCFSPAWRDAHVNAIAACARAAAEQQRLAKNPRTRYGNWRTPGDIELMLLGYL
jgi:hypothetical protein